MPMRHGEKGQRAAQHIPGLADHGERRDHRWSDAGGDDQCREGAHDRSADETARLLPAGSAGKPRLERRRNLEVEQAEHRKCEHDEQRGEHDDDPGLLEKRLRLLAGGRESGAGDRVSERHAEDVDHGQHE